MTYAPHNVEGKSHQLETLHSLILLELLKYVSCANKWSFTLRVRCDRAASKKLTLHYINVSFLLMPGLLKIEACISRWSSLFPSDCSPQNKVPSDSFNVNKAIHISLAAQPRHQQRLSFTNIKDSCKVMAPHFHLSWTVRVALDCLFITNYTFTMATQLHLDWNIQEVERAHNKNSEAASAGASKFDDAGLVSSAQLLILRAIVFSACTSHTGTIKHQFSWLGAPDERMLRDRTGGLC